VFLTILRLAVADDTSLFFQKLVSLLEVEFEVVATAFDGRTAVKPSVATSPFWLS
jgi:hypothetical protein